MRALWRTAPPVLFVMAILSAGFFTGAWVVLSEVFPYDLLAAADKTLRTWVESRRRPDAFLATARFVNVAPESVAERRIEFLAAEALADPVLFSGGPGRFAEYCPGSAGCLAVEYAGRGEVSSTPTRTAPMRSNRRPSSRCRMSICPDSHSRKTPAYSGCPGIRMAICW